MRLSEAIDTSEIVAQFDVCAPTCIFISSKIGPNLAVGGSRIWQPEPINDCHIVEQGFVVQ